VLVLEGHELTTVEVPGEISAKERLGAALAGLRKQRALTGERLGQLVGMSQGKISKLERGVLRASPDDVDLIMRKLDEIRPIEPAESHDLVEQARRLRDGDRPRRPRSQPESPAVFQRDYLDAEAEAVRVRNFEPITVPGLLQISEYTRRVLNAYFSTADGDGDSKEYWRSTAATVAMRARRQQQLYDPDKVFEFVIMESVLGNRYASPSVMLAQLDRLETVARNDNISVKIVPMFAPLGYSPVQGFNVFDDDLVITESFEAAMSHDRNRVEFYTHFFEYYSEIAVSDLGPILAKYRTAYARMTLSDSGDALIPEPVAPADETAVER
jgi:transcriptional regulator with XRE-family HTH domain